MDCLEEWAGKELTLTLVSRVSIPRRPYLSRLFDNHLEVFPADEQYIKQQDGF